MHRESTAVGLCSLFLPFFALSNVQARQKEAFDVLFRNNCARKQDRCVCPIYRTLFFETFLFLSPLPFESFYAKCYTSLDLSSLGAMAR